MSHKNHQITAAIYGHWLIGNLPLKDFRIQEVLNDPRTDFLTLSDVEIHSIAKRECITHVPGAMIPKNQLEFVIVPSERHEAPEKRWNNHAVKAAYQALAIVRGYRISGVLHLPRKPDVIHLVFTHQLSQFFAVTRASVSCDPGGGSQITAPLLLANKSFVSCFHVGEAVHSEYSAVEQQAVGQHVLS
jgi:hypothetical protein